MADLTAHTGSSTVRNFSRRINLSEGVQDVSITADATVTRLNANILRITGDTSDRSLTAHADLETEGSWQFIINAGTTNSILWKSSGASTITTIPYGAAALVVYTGAAWRAHQFGAVSSTGALTLPDNVALTLGAGSDGILKSDGTDVLLTLTSPAVVRVGSGMWAAAPSPAQGNVTAISFFRDFAEDEIGATGWVVTEDDAADTQVVNDALGGTLTLTCKAATDDDACQVIWAQELFKLTSGKKLWFEARIKTTAGSVAQSDWAIGLIEAEDLTGVADNHPANGIVFYKDDGAATYKLGSSDGGSDTNSAATVGTFVDSTYTTLGFYFNGGATGVGTLTPYVDGTAGTAIIATYATMAELAPFVMVRNGDAVTTQNLVIDYFKVIQER